MSTNQANRHEPDQEYAVPQNREAQGSCAPPYTEKEKDWLKRNWDGEYKFLLAHGLKIHDEDDREEGRRIVRAMMEQDGDKQSEADDYDESHDAGKSFQGHFADYNFTLEELEFIEDGWGNSESFMLCYGLKFYNDENCEEAKAIVRALMSQEDSDSDSGESQ